MQMRSLSFGSNSLHLGRNANLLRLGSVEGGLLLFLLLRVVRLCSKETKRSNSSTADVNAGDRLRSFLRRSLTVLIAESTSIGSIFNCWHRIHFISCYYRIGFQGGFFASERLFEAIKKLMRGRDRYAA